MLLDLLELAINNALRYDPASQQRLVALHGKTISLEVTTIAQRVSIVLRPEGLEFSAAEDTNSDVSLRATLPALIKIGRDGMDNAQLEPGELEINGDPIVGQRFARILSELDIDWTGLLAEHIGEAPSALVTNGAAKAQAIATESKLAVGEQLKEVIKNDMQLVADKTLVEPFLDEVDNLQADADRLQLRLERLLESAQI